MLLRQAGDLEEADKALAGLLTADILAGILAWIPEAWLEADGHRGEAPRLRETYARHLLGRLSAPLEAVRAHLATIPVVCKGGRGAGPIGELPARGRFRWLVSPRSTIIQTSPVHTGRTSDPAACLDQLMDRMVRP